MWLLLAAAAAAALSFAGYSLIQNTYIRFMLWCALTNQKRDTAAEPIRSRFSRARAYTCGCGYSGTGNGMVSARSRYCEAHRRCRRIRRDFLSSRIIVLNSFANRSMNRFPTIPGVQRENRKSIANCLTTAIHYYCFSVRFPNFPNETIRH